MEAILREIFGMRGNDFVARPVGIDEQEFVTRDDFVDLTVEEIDAASGFIAEEDGDTPNEMSGMFVTTMAASVCCRMRLIISS